MIRLALVDHGAGNLVSIGQGLARAGAEVVVAESPGDLAGTAGVVLPGVGATGAAMQRLAAAGMVEALRRVQAPLLGICVGVQLFFEWSEEDGERCLGLFPGAVRRLAAAPRLPHIGWNELRFTRSDPLFGGIADGATFYFVHSYVPHPADPAVVIAESEYGEPFVAAVRSGTRVGVQFHPERSGPDGLRVLANFVAECAEAADAA